MPLDLESVSQLHYVSNDESQAEFHHSYIPLIFSLTKLKDASSFDYYPQSSLSQPSNLSSYACASTHRDPETD